MVFLAFNAAKEAREDAKLVREEARQSAEEMRQVMLKGTRDTVAFQTRLGLYEMSREIARNQAAKPYLQHLFAEGNTSVTNASLATNYVRQALTNLAGSDVIPDVESAEELAERLWEPSTNFESRPMQRLRDAFDHASLIVENAELAFDARQEGILSTNQVQPWLNALNTMGVHPIYLAVLESNRRHELIDTNLHELIRSNLCQPTLCGTNQDVSENRAVIRYFYPALCWPETNHGGAASIKP